MYLLEYDDERSGGFEPLRHLLPGKMVTLGLITSKTGKLEDKKVIVQRILDAARYAPLNQLSVGMQCGFSSTGEFSIIQVPSFSRRPDAFLGCDSTRERAYPRAAVGKIKLCQEIVEEVWGQKK